MRVVGKTLFEKIWARHVAKVWPEGSVLLYIDRHLVHEVTNPQAFEVHTQNRIRRIPVL